MSVFNPTSVLNQFHANIATITSASPGAFTRSAYRFTMEKEPDSGPDGMYSIDVTSVEAYSRKFGTGENVSIANLAIRVAYFRGGGNKGEGDRFNVMRHAADDLQLIADVCENPENYNASSSGISVVVYDGFSRVADLPKSEIWEARFTVTWRSDLQTAAAIDLMLASMTVQSTTILTDLNVLSLASGTAAVISGASPALYFLDRDNTPGDSPDGSSILDATGVTGAVWRLYGASSTSTVAKVAIRNASRVLFTGDSNTAALEWYRPGLSTFFDAGSTELAIGFVRDVNTRLATPIVEVNTAVNGAVVQDLIDNFAARIGSQTPDVIIPYIGINDATDPTPTVGIASKCLALGALLAAMNKPVIWPSVLVRGSQWNSTTDGPAWDNGTADASVDAVNDAIETACDTYGFVFVNQRASALAAVALNNQPVPGSATYLTYDAIHLRPLAAVMLSNLVLEHCEICP